jgi:hypothetical protein
MLNKINTNPGKQRLIVYVVLTMVTLAVYWQVHQFDFTNFDDDFLVYENPHIQSGITPDAIRRAFTINQGDLWSPFLWLSYMLDYQFYGLNAGGYHITNLILHILSALLLFWLFNRMTHALWESAFVAACGIGRLGYRAQRCLERFLLDADPVPLCLVHGKTGYKKIPACSFQLFLRSYEQTDDCNPARYHDSS